MVGTPVSLYFAASEAITEKIDSKREKISASSLDPQVVRVQKLLGEARDRVNRLSESISLVRPSDSKAFVDWVVAPDIMGEIPDALRLQKVFGSLEKIERMLASADPRKETPQLRDRLATLFADLESLKKEMKKIEDENGIKAMEVVALIKSIDIPSSKETPVDFAEKTKEKLVGAKQLMVQNEFYIFNLKHHPKALEAFESLLKRAAVQKTEEGFEAISRKYKKGEFVLVHGEKGSDNPIVIIVYLILPFMIVMNLRRLRHFWVAWRS